MMVDVEVLDVTEDEARALILSIDPLAQFAATQQELQQRLIDLTPVNDPDLKKMWEQAANRIFDEPGAEEKKDSFKDREPLPMRYFVLIPCHSERHQRELLDRFLKEGIPCEAKMG